MKRAPGTCEFGEIKAVVKNGKTKHRVRYWYADRDGFKVGPLELVNVDRQALKDEIKVKRAEIEGTRGGVMGGKTGLHVWLDAWYTGKLPEFKTTGHKNRVGDAIKVMKRLWPNVPLNMVKLEWLKDHLTERGAGADKAVLYLKTALAYAVKCGHIVLNPADDLTPLPYDVEEQRALMPAELAFLVKHAKDFADEVAVRLFVAVGPRIGELVAFKWANYDAERGFLFIKEKRAKSKDGDTGLKSKAGTKKRLGSSEVSRRVRLYGPTIDLLNRYRAWCEENGKLGEFMFTAPEGGGWHQDTFRSRRMVPLKKRAIKAAKEKNLRLNMEFKPHELRHTAITYRVLARQDVMRIGKELGQATPSITHEYMHYLEDADLIKAGELCEWLGIGHSELVLWARILSDYGDVHGDTEQKSA